MREVRVVEGREGVEGEGSREREGGSSTAAWPEALRQMEKCVASKPGRRRDTRRLNSVSWCCWWRRRREWEWV